MSEKPTGSGRIVVIVGTGSVQNRLLARVIERAGYACTVMPAQADEAAGAAALALADAAELGEQLPALCAARRFAVIAVLNADAPLAERIVGLPGVKGIFFRDTTEDQLLRGIAAIFGGEYWLPRRLLCAHLESTRTLPGAPEPDGAGGLTPKEKETLRLLAGGRSTGDIALALKVSPHTVKTHLYNLFRKIRVTSRVQAVHWASQHLRLPDPRLPR